jgi:hypothetical protein
MLREGCIDKQYEKSWEPSGRVNKSQSSIDLRGSGWQGSNKRDWERIELRREMSL